MVVQPNKAWLSRTPILEFLGLGSTQAKQIFYPSWVGGAVLDSRRSKYRNKPINSKVSAENYRNLLGATDYPFNLRSWYAERNAWRTHVGLTRVGHYHYSFLAAVQRRGLEITNGVAYVHSAAYDEVPPCTWYKCVEMILWFTQQTPTTPIFAIRCCRIFGHPFGKLVFFAIILITWNNY